MQETGDEGQQDQSGAWVFEHLQHFQLLEIVLFQYPQIPIRQPHLQTTLKHLLHPGHEEGLREN